MSESQQELLIEHYIVLGQYEKTIPLLRDTLAANPQEAKSHYWWAYVHYSLQRYEEVEEHAQEAIRFGYLPEKVYFLLGKYYLALERYGRARAAMQEALRLAPDDAIVNAAYANLMIRMDEVKEAKRFMKRAMSLEFNNPEVLNYHVQMKIALSKSREQLQAMLMRIRSGGDEKNRQITMAMYEQLRHNFPAAREHYRQAFLLDPQDRDVQEALYRVNLFCHPLLWPMRLSSYIGGPHIAFYCTIPILILGFFYKNQFLGDICLLFFLLHTIYVLLASLTVQGLVEWNRRKIQQERPTKTINS